MSNIDAGARKKGYTKHPNFVSLKSFNRFIRPYLTQGRRGPKPQVSHHHLFNYILLLKTAGMIPVIHPNRRNAKQPILVAGMYRWFDRITYKLRFRIERCFAGQDTYRRLVACYERLIATHRGFRCLAYAVMNLRNSL